MSESRTLLPPSATPLSRTLETVMAERKEGIAAPIGTLWNVDTCPVDLLPWLAWAFSVEIWESDWPEAVKREVIRSAISVHHLKGTRQSVKIALGALGFRIDLVEAWEEGGTPYTFRIDAYGEDVLAAGFQIDAALLAHVRRLIENVKPVRARFSLRIGESFNVTTTAGAGLRQRRRRAGELLPQPRIQAIESSPGLAPGLRRRTRCGQALAPQPRPHMPRVSLALKVGLDARQSHPATFQLTPREGAAYAK